MSNSVVKVTDSTLNDSLFLLVGEDGTVTPNKNVVEAYLGSKSGATNLQVMHINKSDSQSIEVTVNDMLYLPESEGGEETNFDEVAYNLHNVKLDHDYTHQYLPLDDVDELAKTLSILDGDAENVMQIKVTDNEEGEKIESKEQNVSMQSNYSPKVKLINTQVRSNTKNQKKNKPRSAQNKGISNLGEEECDSQGDEFEDKQKGAKRVYKHETKTKEGTVKVMKELDLSKMNKLQTSETKLNDKKLLKKERKPTKPVVDDFALFSTPDIIRRVGGKDPAVSYPTTQLTNLGSPDNKPAKIEVRSKSFSESPTTLKKQNRLSLDGKVFEKWIKPENKNKDKKCVSDLKVKQNTVEHNLKKSNEQNKGELESSSDMQYDSQNAILSASSIEGKSFTSSLPEENGDLTGGEQNMSLDGNSLDLDPTLLDNINNDLISEDILYQVAQSLVSNTELQNAIDKSLNEESLALDASVQDVINPNQETDEQNDQIEQMTSNIPSKGTQIVRPDGRIVVIPPIERPTTRSRNKKKEEEGLALKFTRKPLDEEHVSGNELDSSDEEEEEESEDDPNKLWCICNQPHNNRFMICCDTCEEWYHGKCVNITKAMGQQMESEGREWICLFCKDPLLKRPQAAAKRIRKASRNSRQSSDSASSTKISETKSNFVPCVVCQKPSRNNSIFCSESCILVQAQGVERVVVFERATGNMLTGSRAPSAANLEQWLKDHPGYEVVRSAGKIVTTKQTQNITQSKLKFVKDINSETENRVVQNKNFNGGVTKLVKGQIIKSPTKGNISTFKIVNKQPTSSLQREKLVSPTKESMVSSPSRTKVVQTSVKPSTVTPNKEKPTVVKTPRRHTESSSSQTPQAKQENIRENVQKTIFEQLTNRLKMVNDLKLSEEELKDISTEIESQLYKCFGDTGQKYRNKYRSLIFNIKDIKNQTLWRRICEKSINPYQLVRLSPDDLASQELALWREREAKHQLDMIKKSELELLKCNRQYVLKTHKGEQILEDNRPTDNIDNTEVITSLTDSSNGEKSDRKKDYSKEDKKNSKSSHKDKDRKTSKSSDPKSHHRHRSSSRDHDRNRKRSRSRDRTSKHGDKKRSKSRERDRHKRSSHKSSKHKKETHRGGSTEKLDKKSKEILEQLVDNKIVPPLEDRLWKHVSQEDIVPAPSAESDSDHEPTSTVTIPTPPRNNDPDEVFPTQVINENKAEKNPEKERMNVNNATRSPQSRTKPDEIWRGVISMIDVAQISITAHEVSGDCGGLSLELPSTLDIVGRISPDTVWDYIGKMKCSNSKIISVVRLNATNVEEKMPYLALYSYLSSRNRLGVIKSTNKAVKDFYILPLASQKPIPQALLPLNGPGFEEARPALLLGIIVRDKRKRPYIDTVPAVVPSVKKSKTDIQSTLTRSYTPPPVKDSRLQLPLPPSIADQDGDEPYSPEDSDPDSAPSALESAVNNSSSFLEPEVVASQTFQPFANKFDDIPGLENTSLPSSTREIQRQMEKLNKEIEMQKSEINSISQNIATVSTEIGTSALASIALPSNLQQILDSIKTIGSGPTVETLGAKPQSSGLSQESSDFTIPLMLPTTFSRHSVTSTTETFSENTIPLNLPKKKVSTESEKPSSVLSSLSEEDLIRKAEEMLEDSKKNSKGNTTSLSKLLTISSSLSSETLPKLELKQPPIPGLEDIKN